MRRPEVLIVEDETVIARDPQDIFTNAGHEVVGIAMTTAQALEAADRLRRDHGVEALFVSAHVEEEARARSPGWKLPNLIGKPYLPPARRQGRRSHRRLSVRTGGEP